MKFFNAITDVCELHHDSEGFQRDGIPANSTLIVHKQHDHKSFPDGELVVCNVLGIGNQLGRIYKESRGHKLRIETNDSSSVYDRSWVHVIGSVVGYIG